MRSLVIAPCSAKKRGDVLDPALAADLADPERRRQAEARLAEFACPARDLYTGTHHRLVMDGLRAVWDRWGPEIMDLAILSGGYGLVAAEEVLIPYDVTFDQFEGRELAEWVARLQIPQRAAEVIGGYDLAFLLLSGRYLAVLDLPLAVPPSVQQIVLTAKESLGLVPAQPNLQAVVAAGGAAAQRWHVKADHVRGFLFRRLCKQIVQHGPLVLEWLYEHPEDIDSLFYKWARWRPQRSLW